MSLVFLASQYGAISADALYGVPDVSLEIESSALTTAYSVIWDPLPNPRPSVASMDGLRRTVDTYADFDVDIVICPDGSNPDNIPPIRLRPPSGGKIAFSWIMSGMDGVVYARLKP